MGTKRAFSAIFEPECEAHAINPPIHPTTVIDIWLIRVFEPQSQRASRLVQTPIRKMYRAEHHRELVAFALRIFQYVVQVCTPKSRPRALDHRLKLHWLVETAVRRVCAIEVQPVRTG